MLIPIRWFGARAREEDGLPRLTRKSPEQVAILEDSFSRDPYPSGAHAPPISAATIEFCDTSRRTRSSDYRDALDEGAS